MNISLNLVLAVALVASALLVVLTEVSIRRRMRHYRALQLFALGSALLLVPSNVVMIASGNTATWQAWVVVGSLAALVVQIGLAFQGWIPVHQAAQPRRVLAIGAHPDDLELACGGTLARLTDSGHEVHTLIMSDGAVGGDSDVRLGEALRGSSFLGAVDCDVVGLPDAHLADHEVDMMQAIESKIRALNPDIILTHSSHDQHQDHAAVHWATMRAARSHPAILCYESPSVTAEFTPSVFVDINDYVGVKSMAVDLHHNQSAKPYMAANSVGSVAAFRGRQSRLGLAEGFEAVRVPAFRGVL